MFGSEMGGSGVALAPRVGVERLGGGLQVQTCWHVPAYGEGVGVCAQDPRHGAAPAALPGEQGGPPTAPTLGSCRHSPAGAPPGTVLSPP